MNKRITKVLIANRGEIAVRVARACKDAGIATVAVYAIQDRDALHVKLCDEAYALAGATPADSYLSQSKILAIARRSDADAIHPGYGFLSENAEFAQAVIDAGLIWIGPPPSAIDALGDKVKARHIAHRANAPLAPGTDDPVSGPDEVIAFAKEHGLPVAIKAAYGGGGRGLRVVRALEDIPDNYDSAVREAVAAFGRGECFVERYLDRPRHVETQCLADQHGNIVVVSTRDCSLQRRHQKLVEEAPAPFLSDEQNAELVRASKAILKEAGYVGAGTCEFLIDTDGNVCFLEVNARLQVEHPVTEEVTGIDLVREQLRIAEGGTLTYDDPSPRGHSIEFRINGEDPSRNFMPAPGIVTTFRPPSGPGVRLDTGVLQGDEVVGAFDSMLGKLIVTGATRQQALERARRALAEFVIEGLPTVLPFHQAVVRDRAFAPGDPKQPFTIHTRWIETEFTNTIAPHTGPLTANGEPLANHHVVVEVGGKRMEVVLPPTFALGAQEAGTAIATAGANAMKAVRRAAANRRTGTGRSRSNTSSAVSGDALVAPMQGTVVKVAVGEGDTVAEGDLVMVLEAMKMEQPLNAHKGGVISGLNAQVGATVTSGTVLCSIA